MRISLNTKILAILLSFILLVAVGFAVYLNVTTNNYKTLRLKEVVATIQYESEQVNKTITRYEQNAIDLANIAGNYLAGSDHTERLGERLTIENFTSFPEAAGGGIWYEPYAFHGGVMRYCFYACDDETGTHRIIDPAFRSVEYDYLTQDWYTAIKAGTLAAGAPVVVWTKPYFDDAGTFDLMTTVGVGAMDDEGNFVGMSTVDWLIQSVLDQLTAIRPTESSFVVMTSPADDYILTNTQYQRFAQAYAGHPLSALPWYEDLAIVPGEDIARSDVVINDERYLAFSSVLDNGFVLTVQIPENEIFAEIEQNNVRFTRLLIAAAVLVVIIVLIALTLLINRPLKRIMQGVRAIGEGHLDERIELKSNDEIGLLADTFNKMTADLQAHIENSAREYAEKERIRGELNVATQIQSSLLPSTMPSGPETSAFDVVARMYAAREVGGDFYDFYLVDENRLCVTIADVSGKGVPAALFMVVAKALLKTQALTGATPEEVFYAVNNQLCENNEAGMFVTCFMGILDVRTGLFTYVNAGHNLPFLRRDGVYTPLEMRPGFVLGGMEEIRYKQQETYLVPGDVLFMYTDGVSEANNPALELLTDARTLELVNEYKDDTIQALLQHIKEEIDTFADGAEQADDITMLGMAYFGVGEEPPEA